MTQFFKTYLHTTEFITCKSHLLPEKIPNFVVLNNKEHNGQIHALKATLFEVFQSLYMINSK